ncbi:MAG TPA: hypothetical protein VIY56_05535 [Vicinamibacterales bacterium]
MNRLILAAVVLCATAVVASAQQTTSSSETKSFEILAVEGNTLVARLPEGTRELTVADDFRFMINGKPMGVRELKPGMKGTATITTRTTVTPVTVTEVKNGTVAVRSGSTIIVRTPEGVRSFTQGEVDKRGVKIVRDGKPVQLSQLREGDQLSAVIITSQPPRVVTEQEVNATLAAAKTTAGGAAPSAAAAAPRPASSTAAPSAAAAPAASSRTGAQGSTPSSAARTLPATASSWPLLGLASLLLLAMGCALTMTRYFVR